MRYGTYLQVVASLALCACNTDPRVSGAADPVRDGPRGSRNSSTRCSARWEMRVISGEN